MEGEETKEEKHAKNSQPTETQKRCQILGVRFLKKYIQRMNRK